MDRTTRKPPSKIEYPKTLRGLPLTLAERAVLLDLWAYSGADMREARPSKATLAKNLSMSRDGVRKALRSLEEKGFIVAVQRGGWTDQGNRATHYDLVVPAPGTAGAGEDESNRGATESPTGGLLSRPRGATESPLSDPSSDPSSKIILAPLAPDSVEEPPRFARPLAGRDTRETIGRDRRIIDTAHRLITATDPGPIEEEIAVLIELTHPGLTRDPLAAIRDGGWDDTLHRLTEQHPGADPRWVAAKWARMLTAWCTTDLAA